MLKQLYRAGLNSLTGNAEIRSRLAFNIQHNYFDELDLEIPLSDGFVCPVFKREHLVSFQEIFICQEYAPFLKLMDVPDRWIDLGCHAGYFSLYAAWQHKLLKQNNNVSALLVDADTRVEAAVKRLLQRNSLDQVMLYCHGVISENPAGEIFSERPIMMSSAHVSDDSDSVRRHVQRVAPDRILRDFPPPYDLIKADIEGGEYDLFASYQDVLQHTSAILLEWHSWQRAESLEGLLAMVAPLGFTKVTEVQAPRKVPCTQFSEAHAGTILLQK